MTDKYRIERIERLLHELEYEVTRGMLEREIDEEVTFQFMVPRSKHFPDGIVFCEFRTRPQSHPVFGGQAEPKLKIVSG